MEQIGQQLGARYVLEERIGAGAMGVVYLGRHQKLGRAFAIKILHDALTAEPGLVRRFVQEAEIAGRLRHRNVVQIIDFGETDDGTPYTVMDLVIGQNLTALLGSPFASERVICLARQMLDGLQHAHEVGLIHRDFKPDNVIVEVDERGHETPRIVDFGIAILRRLARSHESQDRLTTMGVVLGTPEYMAPEQARGLPIDHRADLFAVGITCYEMLTGKLPFDGSGLEITVANMSEDPPAMARRMTGEVDPLLEAFTRKLIARNPDDRPQSAREARALLDLIERDRAAAAAALGLTPKTESAVTVPLPLIDRAEAEREPDADEARKIRGGHRAMQRRLAVGACAVLAAVSTLTGVMTSTRSSAAAKTSTVASAADTVSVSADSTPDLPFATMSLVESPALPVRAAIVLESPPQRVVATSPRRARITASRERLTQRTDMASDPATSIPEADVATERAPSLRETMAEPSDVSVNPTATPPITASGVAALYVTIGQDLAELSRARGAEAASDLWTRYRRVRINETFESEASRARGEVVLSAIKNEIAARTNGTP